MAGAMFRKLTASDAEIPEGSLVRRIHCKLAGTIDITDRDGNDIDGFPVVMGANDIQPTKVRSIPLGQEVFIEYW